jgi:hypothetical protein
MQAEARNWELMEFPHSSKTVVIGRPALPGHLGDHGARSAAIRRRASAPLSADVVMA